MHWQKCYGPKKGQQLAYCSHALCWKWGDLKGICIEWELQQLVMLYRLHISWPTAASMFLQAPKDIQIYQTEWMLLVQISSTLSYHFSNLPSRSYWVTTVCYSPGCYLNIFMFVCLMGWFLSESSGGFGTFFWKLLATLEVGVWWKKAGDRSSAVIVDVSGWKVIGTPKSNVQVLYQ